MWQSPAGCTALGLELLEDSRFYLFLRGGTGGGGAGVLGAWGSVGGGLNIEQMNHRAFKTVCLGEQAVVLSP